MHLAPGDTVAGYTVVRELGSGGMGAVYLVRHPRLPRLDALKLLRRELCDDPDFARRFMREADVVAGLSHRNIVGVLDRGDDGGQLWLAMQYVDGIDAETALEQAGGLLPAPRAVHVVTEVAAALDAAHRRQLVHRDVKPANILLGRMAEDGGDEPEQVFLTDFGIAKPLDRATRLTRTGMVIATFDYASPEQIASEPLDARSDVYSLGCVLVKLLTGTVPFPGDTAFAALHGHLGLPPPRVTDRVPWLPPNLDDVVLRALAKDRTQRFGTCRELASAAAAALDRLPPAPAPPLTLSLVPGLGTTTAVRPVSTERMPTAAIEQLTGLLRRTRFLDLPEVVPPPRPEGGSGRRTALEVTSGAGRHRVELDLDDPRLPAEFGELVAAVEKLGSAPVREPETVVERAGPLPLPPPPRPVAVQPPAPPPRSPRQRLPDVPAPVPDRPVHPGTPVGPTSRPAPAGRGGRGPWVLVAVVVAVLVAAGGTWWFLQQREPGGGTGAGGSSSATSTSGTSSSAATTTPVPPAQAAFDALPRAGALPGNVLVVPRIVDGATDLYLVDADTGATTLRLTSAPGGAIGPVVSPDRQTVVYQHATDSGGELRAVASDGSDDRPLFEGDVGCPRPGRPAWNPADPTQLVVACSTDEGISLRLLTLDGATVRTLDPGSALVDDLSVSPDGTLLVFWGAPDTNPLGGDLFTLPLDGSAGAQRITDSAADADPAWSPDGARIAFRRAAGSGESRILTVAADGSGEQRLTAAGATDQDPIWSPDGDRIAFKSNRPGPQASSGDHIWVMASDGSDQRQLDDGGGTATNAPAWGNR
ncbi:protein kinase [Geodermatophilus sp. SYSU D00691]